MTAVCGTEVIPVSKPEEAAQNLDIVMTATSAREPCLKGEWISPGQHLNIVGSNYLTKSEIDVEVVKRANVIFIDQKDQGKLEAGDLVAAFDHKSSNGSTSRKSAGWWPIARRDVNRREEVTLFKSLGIGLEDIAVAVKVLAKAKEAGIGKWLEL